MTAVQQIKARLDALSDYEFSILRNIRDGWEDSDGGAAADRELIRVMEARSRLNAMLREAMKEETPL